MVPRTHYGEYSHGILLNRIVGLFQVNHMKDTLEDPNLLPDRVFFNGVEGNPDDLEMMVKENLQSL